MSIIKKGPYLDSFIQSDHIVNAESSEMKYLILILAINKD